jgi:NADPH:quinone reductase
VSALPSLPWGGLAEWVVVPEDYVNPISESLDWNGAAAMFITFAFYALHRCAKIQPGDVLLVHAPKIHG